MRAKLTSILLFLTGVVALDAQSTSALLQVTTFAGQPGVRGFANGAGTSSKFYNPTGLIVDKDGNLIVADSCTASFRKITPAGVVSLYIGGGYDLEGDTILSGSKDGTGSDARIYIGSATSTGNTFDPPDPELVYIGSTSLGSDAAGNIFFADTLNNTVRRISTGAAVSTFAGTALSSGTTNGTGSAARFNIPAGVTVDPSGNVFVTDTGNFLIRKITPAGVVTTFAGTARVSGSADGTGAAARFSGSMSIAADSAGNVFVADKANHTIRKITPAGVVSTFAGSAGKPGSSDGQGAHARFNFPGGIAVDKGNNIFVADTGNHTIRMITSDGQVRTVGGQVQQSGTADGTGNVARFLEPSSIAVDSSGTIYISDTGNNTIRRATLVTGSTVTNLQIQSSPKTRYVNQGGAAIFTVTATSPASISYQWMKNGAAISGATNSIFGISSSTYDDAGFYSVVLTSGNATLTSAAAELKVFTPTTTIPAVIILTHPADQTVAAGNSVTFTVDYVALVDPLFQWKKDDVDIVGANSASYTIASVQSSDAGKYSVYIANGAGSATSNAATLTVTPGTGGVAPSISTQPTSQTVTAGNTATFTVAASGTPTPSYQWKKDGTAISGATLATLSVFNAQSADAGSYTVVVTNASGSVTSSAATLTVTPVSVNVPPAITTQPLSTTVTAPASFTLSVVATGTPTPTYQWKKDGTAISGATNNTFTVATTTTTDSGNYTVVITNVAGSITSTAATVTVNPSVALWSRIVNLSIRSTAGTGDQALIAGFVVSGGNKPLLVRGIGPTMGLPPFNVTGVLADPQLTLFKSTTQIATNDNWGSASNASQISAKSAELYAFALGNTSKDAVLLQTIGEGTYTAQITGVGNTTGIALAEVYDADTTMPARLVNVSARTQVGTGDNILVVGFVITGNTPQKVLIRGAGPTLSSSFGISGALADPLLVVFKDQTEVARNDNWGSASNVTEVSAAISKVYAFPFASATSKDAALLLTLQPGNYTAQVSGVGSTTGIGLAEVYEVSQ